MKINTFITITTLLTICLSVNVQAKKYVCGLTGELVLSEAPCDIPETDLSITPLKADVIDKPVIDATVKIMRKAILERDILAIDRLLVDDFHFLSYAGNWEGRVLFNADKITFFALMREQLLGITRYEQLVESYSVKNIDGQLIAETLSVDTVWLGDDKIESKLLERIKVVSVDGFAKIKSIKQVELK